MITKNGFIIHYGVKGMHWGVRRYQNYDGTRIGSTPSLNPGLSMPMPRMHAERVATKSPRHTGRNPRRQSLRNTVIGYSTGHYLRNKFNKNLPKNEAEAKEQGWIKLSKKESEMHQFHREDGVRNSKWISPDGHREVVYTGKGENQHITTDPRDAGTYNFANPKTDPIGHTVFDVIPYVLVGNSYDDSTNLVNRLLDPARNLLNDISTKTVDEGEKWVNAHTRRT